MKYLLAFWLAELIFFTILLMTTLRIQIMAKRKEKDDRIHVKVTAWFGLISLEYQMSTLELARDYSGLLTKTEISTSKTIEEGRSTLSLNELKSMQKQLIRLLKRVRHVNRIIKAFARQVHVDKLVWRSAIGNDDAAATGTLAGLVWGIKSCMIGLLSSFVTMSAMPKLDVQPLFNEKRLETEFEGMFRFRIGHAMLAGIRILLNVRKRRESLWQSTLFKA